MEEGGFSNMAVKYQLFSTATECEAGTININTLLGYPSEAAKTYKYRNTIAHPTLELYLGGVDDNLVAACANMAAEERENYYTEADLKTYEECLELGFFAPPKEEIIAEQMMEK